MQVSSPNIWHPGRICILLGYLSVLFFAIYFIFDPQHFMNERWPRRAQFHMLWMSSLLSALAVSGIFIVVNRWQAGITRRIFRWIPVFVWTAHLLCYFIVSVLPPKHTLAQEPTGLSESAVVYLLIFLMLIVGYVGVVIDTHTENGFPYHFSQFSSL